MVSRSYIPYPASAGGAFLPGQPMKSDLPYEKSVSIGVDRSLQVMHDMNRMCPSTKFFVIGYSQGAQVASEVARKIAAGHSVPVESVAGVSLISDPTRAKGAPTVQDGAQKPSPVPGTRGLALAALSSFASPEDSKLDGGGIGPKQQAGSFGALAPRTVSWCTDGDLVCDLPGSGPLTKTVIGTAEKLQLTDPEKAVNAVSDALNPAVTMSGVGDLDRPVNFGAGGFDSARVAAASAAAPTLEEFLTTGNQALADSAAPAADLAGGIVSGQIDSEDAVAAGGRALSAAVKPSAKNLGGIAGDVVNGMGLIAGMGLGAGLAIAKEAITPQNLAELVLAGIASPQAAAAVAAKHLMTASTKVLTPKTAVGAQEVVFDQLEVAGVKPKDVAEVAVQVSGHGYEHTSYSSKPVTSSGQTAVEKTREWIAAAAEDLGARSAVKRIEEDGLAQGQAQSQGNSDFSSQGFKDFLTAVKKQGAAGE